MLSKLGGFPAGVTCFVEDGILCCEYNLFEIQRTKIRARLELPPGKVKIEIAKNHPDFVPSGSLNVTMKVNGELVAEGTAPVTCPIAFSANECLDIGIALGSPVSLDYYDKAPFRFNGTIERVEVRYTPRNRNETLTRQRRRARSRKMQPLGARNDDWGPVNVTVAAALELFGRLFRRHVPTAHNLQT